MPSEDATPAASQAGGERNITSQNDGEVDIGVGCPIPNCFGEYDSNVFGKCVQCQFALPCAQKTMSED